MNVKIENLSFKYPQTKTNILSDISIDFKVGSINLILGLNGSGKTTLIKCLTGLLDDYSGKIIINDEDVKEFTLTEKAKFISYVPQITTQSVDFKVMDFLLFGYANILKFYEKPTKTQKEEAIKIASTFGITKLLNKNLDELSGGEKQLVYICQTIIQNTDLIILDEPTSSLDLCNQQILLNALNDLVTKFNKTIILTSHNPNHGLFLNSHVILLKEGKVIGQGPSSIMIDVERLKEIYGNNLVYSKDLNYHEVSFKNNN